MPDRFSRATSHLLLLCAALACSSAKQPPAADSGAAPDGSDTGGEPAGGTDAGLGGRSGSGGSGGARANAAGGGGAGGTTPDLNSPACTPPNLTLTRQEFYARIEPEPCELTDSSSVANPNSARVHDLPLDVPLAAGQAHAVNLSPSKTQTPGSMEIWGASEACLPRELLWFGNMEGRRQCAVFTPTQEHRRLLFIDRQLDVLDGFYSSGPATVSVCPMGTCGAALDGMGLSPGVTLAPPPGLYETVVGETWWVGEQWDYAGSGRILFTRPTSDFPKPILAAVFRTPPHDPYGDAWHCASGSEWSRSERVRSDYLSLTGISRLPNCDAAGSGSATLTWDGPMRKATLTSSVSELNGSELSIAGRCTRERCLVRMYPAQQDRSLHLFLHARGDFGLPGSTPNTQQMEIREALWLSIPKSGMSISYACTTSGTVRYDPKGTTSVTVQNLSSLAACSGTPAANAATKLVLERR